MINPILIQTFLDLAKTGHFTRSAERLHMTQPGVSQHLKKLEEELAVELFHRQGKGIELTPAGETFRCYAQKQQQLEKDLRADLNEDSPHHGTCHLACSGTLAMRLYPPLLEQQTQYPGLHIHLEAAPDDSIISQVKAGDVTFGVITSRREDPELQLDEIGHEALYLALPISTGQSWSDLWSLGYINHPNGAHYANQLLEPNYPDDFKGFKDLPQKSYINQLNQILLPVSLGLGFTVLPVSTVELFPNQAAIKTADLPVEVHETLYLIRKKHKPLPKRYSFIQEIIAKILQA